MDSQSAIKQHSDILFIHHLATTLSKCSWGNLYIALCITCHGDAETLLEVDLLDVNQSNHSLIGAVCVLGVQEHILSDIEKHPRAFQPQH